MSMVSCPFSIIYALLDNLNQFQVTLLQQRTLYTTLGHLLHDGESNEISVALIV